MGSRGAIALRFGRISPAITAPLEASVGDVLTTSEPFALWNVEGTAEVGERSRRSPEAGVKWQSGGELPGKQ